MFYIPTDIMIVITEFLGKDYWKHRHDLTEICIALDFSSSDYTINSYWLWNEWRQRNTPEIRLLKPILPDRLKTIDLLKNQYIRSVDPPETVSYSYLKILHSQISRLVHFK